MTVSAQVLAALELAVPGITESVRYQEPPWISPLEKATEVWLGGINVTHVEVTPEWDAETSVIGRLIINAFTDEGVIAQASVTVDRETSTGTFGEWKIVRLKTITDLEWKEHRFGGHHIPQVKATFKHLPDPVLIPGEVERPADSDTTIEIFRNLRDAWIDTGNSEPSVGED